MPRQRCNVERGSRRHRCARADTFRRFRGYLERQGVRAPQQARLVITESGGTYKSCARTRDDPWVGNEAPITLQDIKGQEAKVLLKFSEALQGCADGKLRIKKVDDKTMTGMRGQAMLTIMRD